MDRAFTIETRDSQFQALTAGNSPQIDGKLGQIGTPSLGSAEWVAARRPAFMATRQQTRAYLAKNKGHLRPEVAAAAKLVMHDLGICVNNKELSKSTIQGLADDMAALEKAKAAAPSTSGRDA